MQETVLDQARRLHKTIKTLQARVFMSRANQCQADPESGPAVAELTIPQMSTMLVVRDGGEMTLKEIAETTGVSAPSASCMVDRLVEYGVLSREHSRVDRREVRISISPAGREIVDAVEQQLLQALVGLIEKIGPEHAQKWCEVYARIQEILDGEDQELAQVGGVYGRGVK